MPNSYAVSLLFTSCFYLAGCTALLERDFNKATLIGEVRLGEATTYIKTLTPPEGEASLIFAVPNQRCSSPKEGTLGLAVRTEGKTLFSKTTRLSDLTWSYGLDSCDAYGYHEGPRVRLQLKDSQPVTFEIDVSRIKDPKSGIALVWLVYGDRVPGAKIYGSQ